jgi:NAD(P)-dependent dehydrogenase (short-subunit alcohol dehydrogenase family)
MDKLVCVIIGVGPGNGTAFAQRFSKEGYTVALLARHKEYIAKLADELKDAYAYECDIANENSVKTVFQQIYQELKRVDVLIYNAGSGAWGNIEEVTIDMFESAWRVNVLGLLMATQQVIPYMKQRKRGSIVVVGATASRRGGINTAAFASAKAAQRTLAESMAKYLWPIGIHVALIIIDGVVDLKTTRERMPDKPDSFFVKPDDVATTAFWLTQQAPSAWSFEVEARPFGESW